MSRALPRFAAAVAGILSLLFASAPAAAYWDFGHQTVARIAWANVTPRTRAAIRRILANGKLADTPTCSLSTLWDAAVWPDCIKPLKNPDGKSRFGYAYNWHFQDVNICGPFDVKPACKDDDCISAQIPKQMTVLRDPKSSKQAKVEALAFLTHFLGDLHQPLHAGEKGDRGGNDVKASWGGYAGTRLNLHAIWDGLLAERAITTGPSLVRAYPASVRRQVAAGDVNDWGRESWQAAHDYAYGSVMPDPCAPTPARLDYDEATIEKLIPVARLEVERGGLRLAKLLDATFR